MNAEDKGDVGKNDGEAVGKNGGVGADEEEGEEEFEVGEERRVVEGPDIFVRDVPLGEREGGGEVKPVEMDGEIRAFVSGG